jgi:plastocyanin
MLFRTLILAAGGAVCGAADHVVDQKERLFSETDLSVKVGDTVTFQNSDPITHNVFSSTPGLEFDIRRQAPGEKSTIPFTKEGVVEVRCSIHPKMKMLIRVRN